MTKGTFSLNQILEVQNALQPGLRKLSEKIIEKIYYNDMTPENTEEFRLFYHTLTWVYSNMKKYFDKIYRSTWERYFEHLREVTNNVLDLPNPSLKKVLIALMHDALEDIKEEWVDFNYLSTQSNIEGNINGKHILLSVEAISKQSWQDYLEEWEEETKENEKNAKALRNQDYFGHMTSFESMKQYIFELAEKRGIEISDEECTQITQNALDVKFADRIHNLSTQWNPKDIPTVQRKLEETKTYFLPIAQETNLEAYKKLNTLVLELEIRIHDAWGKVKDRLNNTLTW
jgi:(p)ppGpp synthase/HD superfamily hydrolase